MHRLLVLLCALLAAAPGMAQTPSAAGQWQCEYATRNIFRTDAHAVYFQVTFNILPNGAFQAQGFDQGSGPFQAQGQWTLQQEQGRWWFSARGQMTHPMFGITDFGFDSYLVGPSQMLLNEQFPTGDQIASACQRRG